jgi:UDP-3-O-[3-hydroxymyristoyl] N-acetylglucosamine deacetylase
VTVKPAPPYTSYLFRRTDLNDFEIPAAPQYVTHVSYATTLMKSGVMISTVEHLLSALYGCGVDNVIIEVDSLEVPILDGSSRQWVELIGQAGKAELPAARPYLRVLKRITVS